MPDAVIVRRAQERSAIGRNPETGKEVPISPRRVMVSKPSAILKQRINAGAGRSSISSSDGEALGR
jgi:integration host factor subunit alpha